MNFPRSFTATSIAAFMALTTLAAPYAYAEESPTSESSTRPTLFHEENTSSPLHITIDELSPRVITTHNTLTLSATVRNDSDSDLHSSIVTVAVQNYTSDTVNDLAAYINGKNWDGEVVYQEPLTLTIPAGQSQTFTIHINRSDLPLRENDDWGPRGITLSINTYEYSAQDRSTLVWDSGTTIRPVDATLALAVNTHTLNPLITAPQAITDLSLTPGVALIVDPQLIAADTPQSDTLSAPHSAKPPLTAASFHHDIYPLLPFDADPALIAETHNEQLIQAAAHHDPHLLTPPTGASAPQSGADASPLTTHLTPNAHTSKITTTHPQYAHTPPILWPADSHLSLNLIQTFPTHLIIGTESTLQPDTPVNFTPTPLVAVNRNDGTTALNDTPQDDTSTHSATPTDTTTVISQYQPLTQLLAWNPTTPAEHLDRDQLLSALGALSARENHNRTPDDPSVTFFATLPRTQAITHDTLTRIHALLNPRWVNGITLTQLSSTPLTDVPRHTLPSHALNDTHTTAAHTINNTLHSITSVAAALHNPTELQHILNEKAFSALSINPHEDSSTHALQHMQREVTKIRQGIHAQPSATINLINKTAQFPVRVANTLPWPAHVTVTLEPSDPRLRVAPPVEATIAPGSTHTVEIPVTAIGAGDIDVSYVVRAPNGDIIDASQTVDVRLRAGWEDALTATFGLIVAVAFISGLIRTIRRRIQAHDAPGTGGPIMAGMIPVSDYLDRKENQ